MKICKICGVNEATRKANNGVCGPCRHIRYGFTKGYTCGSCGVAVSNCNKGGLCKKCTGLAKRRRVERQCANCGKTVEVLPYVARDMANSFCDKNCCNEWQRRTAPNLGAKSPNFIDGPRFNQDGYVQIYQADGPKNHRRRFEHVLIAEAALGRKLKRGEVVHHINMDKADNRNCNLLICSNSYHHWLHHQMGLAWVKEHIRK